MEYSHGVIVSEEDIHWGPHRLPAEELETDGCLVLLRGEVLTLDLGTMSWSKGTVILGSLSRVHNIHDAITASSRIVDR